MLFLGVQRRILGHHSMNLCPGEHENGLKNRLFGVIFMLFLGVQRVKRGGGTPPRGGYRGGFLARRGHLVLVFPT